MQKQACEQYGLKHPRKPLSFQNLRSSCNFIDAIALTKLNNIDKPKESHVRSLNKKLVYFTTLLSHQFSKKKLILSGLTLLTSNLGKLKDIKSYQGPSGGFRGTNYQ